MDNSKIRTELTCYIGETAYKAGIFLSYRIAERKSYFKNLKLERFTSFNEAEDEFKKRYGEVVDMTIFKLNHLYSVRSQNVYSVFWTPLNVGICYTCAFSDAADMLIPEDDNMRWWKHGLTYDEAQRYASSRFCAYYRNPYLYIWRAIRVNTTVNLAEVKVHLVKNKENYF